MDLFLFMNNSQRRTITEALRIHRYRVTKKFRDSILAISDKTNLEIENDFKLNNKKLVINQILDGIVITAQPMMQIFKEQVHYRLKVEITKNKKTKKSNVTTIVNLLKKYQ